MEEKHRKIERGSLGIIPLATASEDYHSVRLFVALYRGTAGMPGSARHINGLRPVYEQVAIPLRHNRPVAPKPRKKPQIAKVAKPEPVAPVVKNPEPVEETASEVGNPLVIRAPE